MQYNLQDIYAGKHTEVDVWVCGYYWRNDDFSKGNACRNVPPTKVRMVVNLPPPNQWHRMPYYYVKLTPYDRKGNLKSKLIPIQDNTNSPRCLDVFDSEIECINHYKDQCDNNITGINEWMVNVLKHINSKIETIQNIKSKY